MARYRVTFLGLGLVLALGCGLGQANAQQAPPYVRGPGGNSRMIVYFRSVAETPVTAELSCVVPNEPTVWNRLRLKARSKFLFWDVFDSTRFICASPNATKLLAKVRPCSSPAGVPLSSFVAGEKVTFAPLGSGVCALSTSP